MIFLHARSRAASLKAVGGIGAGALVSLALLAALSRPSPSWAAAQEPCLLPSAEAYVRPLFSWAADNSAWSDGRLTGIAIRQNEIRASFDAAGGWVLVLRPRAAQGAAASPQATRNFIVTAENSATGAPPKGALERATRLIAARDQGTVWSQCAEPSPAAPAPASSGMTAQGPAAPRHRVLWLLGAVAAGILGFCLAAFWRKPGGPQAPPPQS
jgi:hypothetical protein